MMPMATLATRPLRLTILLTALLILSRSAPGQAAATLGFVVEFPGTSTTTWFGGTPADNPGTGGYLGVGDGFLRLSRTFLGQFGQHSEGPECQGNWQAAGIIHVYLGLKNLATNDPL